MSRTAFQLCIQPSTAANRKAALSLVLQSLPTVTQVAIIASATAAASLRADDDQGVWTAYRGAELVGAVWMQPLIGNTAVAWPPRLIAGEAESTAAALLDAGLTPLRERGVKLVQALLESDHGQDADRLTTAGVKHAADLLYLVSVAGSFPDDAPQPALEFQAYRHEDRSRLESIVEATYLGTCDCPQLNGIRDTSDVLAGYLAVGSSGGDHWYLVQHQGTAIGCLLLADHPVSEQMELVYMGVTLEGRGRGWGIEIVRQAQWLARRAGRARLVLAVDADNAPAIAVYAAAGFVEWDRRSVFLKVL